MLRRNSKYKLQNARAWVRGAGLRSKGPGDWTLKGYNYLGPGNPIDEFGTMDEDDAIAKKHDKAYQDIIDSGQDPYWKYSNADEDARKQFGHGPGGWLASAFFTAKKAVAPRINEEQVYNSRYSLSNLI
jgi:hypothetical protein